MLPFPRALFSVFCQFITQKEPSFEHISFSGNTKSTLETLFVFAFQLRCELFWEELLLWATEHVILMGDPSFPVRFCLPFPILFKCLNHKAIDSSFLVDLCESVDDDTRVHLNDFFQQSPVELQVKFCLPPGKNWYPPCLWIHSISIDTMQNLQDVSTETWNHLSVSLRLSHEDTAVDTFYNLVARFSHLRRLEIQVFDTPNVQISRSLEINLQTYKELEHVSITHLSRSKLSILLPESSKLTTLELVNVSVCDVQDKFKRLSLLKNFSYSFHSFPGSQQVLRDHLEQDLQFPFGLERFSFDIRGCLQPGEIRQPLPSGVKKAFSRLPHLQHVSWRSSSFYLQAEDLPLSLKTLCFQQQEPLILSHLTFLCSIKYISSGTSTQVHRFPKNPNSQILCLQ